MQKSKTHITFRLSETSMKILKKYQEQWGIKTKTQTLERILIDFEYNNLRKRKTIRRLLDPSEKLRKFVHA